MTMTTTTTASDLRDRAPALQRAVDELHRHAPYAHAFAQKRGGNVFRASTKTQAIEPVDPVSGVVLSAWTGRTLLEVSVPGLDDESVTQATARLVELVTKDGVVVDGPKIDPGKNEDADHVVVEAVPADGLSLEDRLSRMVTLKDRIHAKDRRVKNAVARGTHVRTEELFVSSTKRLWQDLRRGETVCLIVMEDGGKMADLHGGKGRQGGAEHLGLADKDIDELVEDCAKLLTATRVDGGLWDCVFMPDMAGLFAHEAFGHGTEADMFTRKRAKGQDFLGKAVASSLVDMFDDPSMSGEAGSFFFDHEGQAASRTQIITKGVLTAPMTDLVSALKLGIPRSANGRRESVQRKAYTRMTNTVFGPGTSKVEDMIASLEHGLVVRHARNGMEDPKGWGIQCEAYLAEEVKAGKKTGKVFSPVVVTGYVPDLLMSISAVGDASEIGGLGMCGKGYKEWVKVTDGGPALKLKARVA
jgi:TldD protein